MAVKAGRKGRIASTAVLVVALGLVSARVGSGAEVSAHASAAQAESRLAHCPYDRDDLDSGSPTGALIGVERWLEPTGFVRPADRRLRGDWKSADVAFVLRGGTTETVHLHASYVEGIDWALRAGGRVHLALASEGLTREMVGYALLRHPDGGNFFAGSCGKMMLTEPIRNGLGERFDATMDAIVGKPGPEVARLLSENGL